MAVADRLDERRDTRMVFGRRLASMLKRDRELPELTLDLDVNRRRVLEEFCDLRCVADRACFVESRDHFAQRIRPGYNEREKRDSNKEAAGDRRRGQQTQTQWAAERKEKNQTRRPAVVQKFNLSRATAVCRKSTPWHHVCSPRLSLSPHTCRRKIFAIDPTRSPVV